MGQKAEKPEARPVSVHEPMRLSKSPLWTWQAEYFASAGVSAWAGTVPFYVTSNPVIAHCYAQVIARYIQDLDRQDLDRQDLDRKAPADPASPIYIIELGAGSGKFSYYCLRYLVELYRRLRLRSRPCYVMTDFTEKNLDFWQRQPLFEAFVAEGFLDMALFDVDNPQPLVLRQSAQRLSSLAPGRAVVCLANYVFDSTRHDLFYVSGNCLYEALVALQAPPQRLQEGRPTQLADLSYRVDLCAIKAETYYQRAILNEVLDDYRQDSDLCGHFLFPLAMLGALEFLRELGGGRLMLLTSDKGYTQPSEIQNRAPPQLTFHGSFSLSINYDAVRRYVEKRQGLCFHPPPGEGLHSCAYILGTPQAALPETSAAISTFLQDRTPYDNFQIYHQLKQTLPTELPLLIAHLRDARWDPQVVSIHASNLQQALQRVNPRSNLRAALGQGLQETERLIYPLSGMKDHFFDLAMLYAALGRTNDAIRMFRQSIERFPNCFRAHYNLGVSYYMSSDIPSAVAAFQRAAHYEADGHKTQQWLARLCATPDRRPARIRP